MLSEAWLKGGGQGGGEGGRDERRRRQEKGRRWQPQAASSGGGLTRRPLEEAAKEGETRGAGEGGSQRPETGEGRNGKSKAGEAS